MTSISVSLLADPEEHTKMLRLMEELKDDPEGWKKCLQKIMSGGCSNDEEHFMLLGVVGSYLTESYSFEDDGQQTMREWMFWWIQKMCAGDQFPLFVVNKVASLFALVFAADFPSRWPQLMQEVFLQRINSTAVVVFLMRTLSAIDSEVVDREINRSQQEYDRNTQIKDAMRELCMEDLARVWASVLANSTDQKARELCLEVIACYVDWIDIELVVNNNMVPLVIDCVKEEDTGEAAIQVMCAILEKGMEPEKKLSLVSALITLLAAKGTLNVTSNSNSDEVARCGSLISSMGTVLIDCMNKFRKCGIYRMSEDCREHLRQVGSVALTCIAHEDWNASQTVTDFIRRYLGTLGGSWSEYGEFCTRLVPIVMLRFKAPDGVNMEMDGENEAEFLDYRKQLKSILFAVGNRTSEIIVECLESPVSILCSKWKQSEVAPVEATISLVYSLADIIPSGFLTSNDVVSVRAKNLILQVVSSDISWCSSPAVAAVFFEIICKYDKLLLANPATIPHLMETFLDSRGLRHPSSKLRTRVVYLFCRFVKAHKQSLGDHAGAVLTQVAPLLAVSPQESSLLTDTDQLFLYEATSTLIVNASLNMRLKEEYMEELARSLLNKFHAGCEQLGATLTEEERCILTHYLSNLIACSSRITKAFTAANSMAYFSATATFVEMMEVFLERVEPDCEEMMDSLRQYLHRMVVCLDSQIYPALPSIFNKFVNTTANLKTFHDFIILVQQIVAKYKTGLRASNLKFRSLFEAVWEIQAKKYDKDDEMTTRNLHYLNRAFLQLIHNIIVQELLSGLFLYGAEFMERLSMFILSSCQDKSDGVAQKVALSILTKIFLRVNFQTEDYVDYLWEKCVRIVLQVPMVREDLTFCDAQTAIVHHEAFACLQALRSLKTIRFDEILKSVLPDCSLYFAECLTELRGKDLDRELDNVYSRLRQHAGLF